MRKALLDEAFRIGLEEAFASHWAFILPTRYKNLALATTKGAHNASQPQGRESSQTYRVLTM